MVDLDITLESLPESFYSYYYRYINIFSSYFFLDASSSESEMLSILLYSWSNSFSSSFGLSGSLPKRTYLGPTDVSLKSIRSNC